MSLNHNANLVKPAGADPGEVLFEIDLDDVEPAPASGLTARLLAQGFRPGVPVHVTERSRRIDQEACRRMVCGACRRKGMECRPCRSGTRYRVAAVCVCGHSEEV